MFKHHGASPLRHDLPGETGRITLPPLWTGTVLAHQPPGDPAPAGTTPLATTPPAPAGQPPAAPAVTFTADQQAAMDRIISDRLERDRAARPAAPANLAELQEQARQFLALQASSQTDQQRAAAEALAQGTTAGRTELLPALVAAEMRAARPGLTAEAAAQIVAPLNAAYFLDPGTGAVDPAKIAAYVATIPAGTVAALGPGGQPVPVFPGLGQGGNGSTPPPAKADAGIAEARRRGFGTTPKT